MIPNFRSRFATALLAACIGMMSSATTRASIQATFSQHHPGADTVVKLFADAAATSLITSTNTKLAGLFKWTGQTPITPPSVPNFVGFDAGGNVLETGTDFLSFCIEITQTVGFGLHNMSLIELKDAPKPGTPSLSPMDASGANAIAKLWNMYLDEALLGLDSIKIGAFQLAVWKLAYDEGGSFDLTSGRLRSLASYGGGSNASAVRSQAQTWLTDVGNYISTNGALSDPLATNYLYALTKGDSINFQDQVVGTVLPPSDTPPDGAVPEATSLVIWALLSGVLGLTAVGRRER